MGGRISVIIEGLGTLLGGIQSGAIKPIAVTWLKRMPNFPDIPTVAETIPGFTATGWFAVLTPNGTPDAIVRKINQDLKAAWKTPDTKKKLEDLATFGRPMTPEETAAFLRSERQVWNPIVRKVGFSSQ